jgi:hypothetical protein
MSLLLNGPQCKGGKAMKECLIEEKIPVHGRENPNRYEADRTGKCCLCREFNALNTPDKGWKKAGRCPASEDSYNSRNDARRR